MSEVLRVRKKPVVVEAMLHDGTKESAVAIAAWADTPGCPVHGHPKTPGDNQADALEASDLPESLKAKARNFKGGDAK